MVSQEIKEKISENFGNIESVKKLNTALTNKVYEIQCQNAKIILKILSKHIGVLHNRGNEITCLKHFSIMEITPKLLDYEFCDYLIFEYKEKTSTKLNDLYIKNLAKNIKAIHNSNLSLSIRDFRKSANDYIAISSLNSAILEDSTFKQCQEEIKLIFASIYKYKQEIATCHNDININNIILGEKAYIIDFEYASLNDIYFDFCALKQMLKDDFDIFCEYYGIKINKEKLSLYTRLLNLLSVLWCYSFNYLEEGKKLYTAI